MIRDSAVTGNNETADDRGDLLILTFLIAFTSSGLVQKYGGLPGLAAYIAFTAAALFSIRMSARWLFPFINKHFRLICILASLGLAALFIVAYPLEDSRGPGLSSDRDQGLNLAVTRMIGGQTPYYPPNPEAGPLSLLPGSVVLAIPFVILGNSAYQNFFWIAAFGFLAWRHFGQKALALVVTAIPLALSPSVAFEYISGGDLISNGIFVAFFFLTAFQAFTGGSRNLIVKFGSAILLGLAIASRANFILLMPLFSAMVWKTSGFREAMQSSLIAGFTWLALIVPFYLNDPTGFTPLLSREKLAATHEGQPNFSSLLVVVTAAASALTALFILWRNIDGHPVVLFCKYCCVVTLVPLGLAVITASVQAEHLDFTLMRDRFGLMYLFFALLGWGGAFIPHERASTRDMTL